MPPPVIRLLRRSLILLAILFVADRLIGAGLEHMFYRQHHGDDAVTRYTLDSTREELLIFGSSRASHHYHTRMLQAALGISVYNCGRDEMGITYTTAVLPIVYKRYAPRYIIIEVLPTELANRGRELSERHISTVLLPFANKYPSLWTTVAYPGKDEVYKSAVSRIYPYNSLIGSLFQNTYTTLGHKTDLGYEPLLNIMDSNTYTKSFWNNFRKAVGVDPDLARRFSDALDTALAHGTKVFVMISPFYFQNDISNSESVQALKQISADRGVVVMDWSFDPRFVRHPRLFNDDLHLNDSGAKLYTRIIIDTLRKCGVGQTGKGFTD
jgi:hypothetical protein